MPAQARDLIVDNADDVVTALKCCGLRHMDRRDRLTRFLTDRLEAGGLPHELPAGLSTASVPSTCRAPSSTPRSCRPPRRWPTC